MFTSQPFKNGHAGYGSALDRILLLETAGLSKKLYEKSKEAPVIADSDSHFYILISIEICFLVVDKHHKTKICVKCILLCINII